MVLTREDMMLAVAEGVRQGVVAMARQHGLPESEPNALFVAVRDGVCDAVTHLATDASPHQCTAFYEAIRRGVAEAMQPGPRRAL